jgi:hypothetical protein
MLETASFSILIHHDDAEREFAYDAGAEKALAAAEERHWRVVSMKNDIRSSSTRRTARTRRSRLNDEHRERLMWASFGRGPLAASTLVIGAIRACCLASACARWG